MIKYCIMTLMMGYSGNKLFGKDKSDKNSILVAVKAAVVLILIDLFIILI